MGSAASVFRISVCPGVNSVTTPLLSVVVVVVSVTPLVPVATVVEVDDVCPKATEPIRTVANAIPIIDLIIRTNFLVSELLLRSQRKAIRFVLPIEKSENQVGK